MHKLSLGRRFSVDITERHMAFIYLCQVSRVKSAPQTNELGKAIFIGCTGTWSTTAGNT